MKRSKIIRAINFLKARRHADALKIRRLRRHADLGTGAKLSLAVAGGILGGVGLGTILSKFVLKPMMEKAQLDKIYSGQLPEKMFVQYFKFYFANGKTAAKRIIEPGVWARVDEDNLERMSKLVQSAKSAKDLTRIFPDCRYLANVAAAYDQLSL